MKQDKYKDVPPTKIDLFKECHCSSKTGFAKPVKKVIADMEAIIAEAAPESQAPKTPAEVVSQVMPKTTFLQNAGFETARPKRSKAAAAVAAHVQELEGQLAAERHVANNLRDKVEHLIKQTKDADSARMKHSNEVETLKSSFQETQSSLEETQALLCDLLKLNKI